MSNRRFFIALSTALFAVLLLARLPASIATQLLPPSISVSTSSGTIWEGSAAHVQVNLNGKWFALGRVDWELHPIGILVGDAVTIRSKWGSQHIDVSAGVALSGEIRVSNATIHTDIGWVKTLLPLFIAGDLKADIDELRVTASGLPAVLTGRIVWENAAWQAVGGDVSLGTYVVDVATDESGISGRVMTLKGALELNGEFGLKGDAYSVAADLSGAAARNEAFQQAIALLAVPTESGYRIDLSGTL